MSVCHADGRARVWNRNNTRACACVGIAEKQSPGNIESAKTRRRCKYRFSRENRKTPRCLVDSLAAAAAAAAAADPFPRCRAHVSLSPLPHASLLESYHPPREFCRRATATTVPLFERHRPRRRQHLHLRNSTTVVVPSTRHILYPPPPPPPTPHEHYSILCTATTVARLPLLFRVTYYIHTY